MSIDYSDGLSIEARILELLKSQNDLGSETSVAGEYYSEWPVKYHLCPERSNLVRHLDFSGLEVLELGAGMGAVSRYLAERAKTLTVVEGTEARFAALSERLRDLDNWSGIVGNITDVEIDKKFDVVCVIGVLEYSEMYIDEVSGKTPFAVFLEKAKSFLKSEGVLLLAIENRLGIKYWSGAAEDHLGSLFDGISGYPLGKSPKTFSRKELKNLLETVGFTSFIEHFPFPDYKIPSTVLTTELIDEAPELAADLACMRRYENYGLPRVRFFSDLMAVHSVARAGLLTEFANSFLTLSTLQLKSKVLSRLLTTQTKNAERAWHYSIDRLTPASTIVKEKNGSLIVEKHSLNPKAPDSLRFSSKEFDMTWRVVAPTLVAGGTSFRYRLMNHVYFGQWDKFVAALTDFIQWSFDRWGFSEGNLSGEAFDAVYVNAVPQTDQTYAIFDLEWKLESPMPQTWFVFRNIMMLERDQELFSNKAPFASFQVLYGLICERVGIAADFEGDLDRETTFYQMVTPRASYDAHYKLLHAILCSAFPTSTYPRSPIVEGFARQHASDLEEQSKELRSLPHKVTSKLVSAVNRLPLVSRSLDQVGPKLYLAAKSARRTWNDLSRGAQTWELRQRPRRKEGEVSYDILPLDGRFPKGLSQLILEGVTGEVKIATLILQFIPSEGSSEVNLKVCLEREGQTFSRQLRTMVDITSASLILEGGSQDVSVGKFSFNALGKSRTAVEILRNEKYEPATFLPLATRVMSSGMRGLRKALSDQVRYLPFVTVDAYAAWIQHYDTLTEEDRHSMKARLKDFKFMPKFSVVVPVYNTDEKWLRSALDSVQKQIYPHWELCLADDASTRPHVRKMLESYANRDPRIKVVFREQNGHISKASNSALALATGEFIALLDHDDELAEHALYMVAEELNRQSDLDIIYSDEDLMDVQGRRFAAHFKPDWNPDLFYSINVMTHLTVFRRSLVNEIGGFREGFEGSQDWDLMLRAIECTSPARIKHLPYILYHWRAIPGSVASGPGEKNYALEAARRAIREHLERKGTKAKVVEGAPTLHRVIYELPKVLPSVTAIICTRDRVDLLKEIVTGLREQTEYKALNIIIVDNGSREPATLQYLQQVSKEPNVKVETHDVPFNFSALNNLAAKESSSEFLLFLNNDLKVIAKEWLLEMMRLAVQPGVGIVGAKLLYPDDRVQHSGVILGMGDNGVAGHGHLFLDGNDSGYWGRNVVIQNFSAVTAACMLVRRSLFNELGGFEDKNLPIAYSDVDLCLKAREKGYRVVWTPYAQLYHFESATRGSDLTLKNRERLESEALYMRQRWGKLLTQDPAYNPNLSLKGTGFELAFPPRISKPWRATIRKQSPKIKVKSSGLPASDASV